MAYRPSPRPTFDRPTLIRRDDAVRHTWGDEEAGFVEDWIYVSSGLLHALVFELPSGGAFRHSEAHRTVFAADELLYVLQGTFVAANPETGEVHRLERGESVAFGRDTWHHGFSYGAEPARVLEFFAPPPSTGSSGAYAQTQPYLAQSRYDGRAERTTMRVLRPADSIWRLEGDALVGVLAATDELMVGTLRLLPGGSTGPVARGGDELVYVTAGSLVVRAGAEELAVGPDDAAYLPAGTEHEVVGAGDGPADAVFGIAPPGSPA